MNKNIDNDLNDFIEYQRKIFNEMWNRASYGIPTEQDLIVLQNIKEEQEFLEQN